MKILLIVVAVLCALVLAGAYFLLGPRWPIQVRNVEAIIGPNTLLPVHDMYGLEDHRYPGGLSLMVKFESSFPFAGEGVGIPQMYVAPCDIPVDWVGRPKDYWLGKLFVVGNNADTGRWRYIAQYSGRNFMFIDRRMVGEEEGLARIRANAELCFWARSQRMFGGYRRSWAMPLGIIRSERASAD